MTTKAATSRCRWIRGARLHRWGAALLGMSSFGVSEIDDSNFLVGVISPIEKHEPT